MKVIISATTNLTWSSHTNLPVKGSNGKILLEVLDERAQAVKEALIRLGVPEDQIEFSKRPLYGDLDGIKESAFQLKFERK